MRTIIKILMGFWILLGVFSIGTGIYFFFTGYTYDGYTFIAFAGVSAVMYWMNTKRMKVYGTSRPPDPRPKK